MNGAHRKSERGRILVASALATTLLGITGVATAMAGEESPAPTDPKALAALKATPTAERTEGLIVGYKSKAAEARSDKAIREDTKAKAAQAGEKLSYDRRLGNGAVLVDLGGMQPAKNVAALMDRFRDDPDVAYVVPDRRMQAQATTSPDDTEFPKQWDLFESTAGMNVPDAWRTSTGQGVTVAVLDTGQSDHTDLATNTVAGYDFVSSTFTSKDGDGRDSDPSDPGDATKKHECGPDSETGELQPTQDQPSSWHGTHVAGTVAAEADNGKGVAGVAHGAKVQPVRVLGRCGGSNSDIIDAITWASGGTVPGVPDNETPARVINMSLGGPPACDPATQSAINGAVQRGTTVVAAAGNSLPPAKNAAGFTPGSCNNVITVAATDRGGDRAAYSNFGEVVDISAPGGETSPNKADGILSTLNSGTDGPVSESFEFYQGTSMAAPHIAGIAALLIAANPALTPAEIETAIKSNARALPGTCEGGCGSGLADAAQTVASVSGRTAPAPDGSPSSPAGAGPAADGNLSACSDGTCEVEVTSGDTIQLDGTAGVDEFTVVSVADNTLAYEASSGNGTQQFSGSQTSPGTSTINDLVVEIISIDGERAVIRIS